MSVKFWLERLALFLSLFVTLGTFSYADNTGVVPPPAGTPLVSGTPFQTVTQAMDKYGQAYVVPGPSGTPGTFPIGGTVNVVATPGATSFLQKEDDPIATGQTGVIGLGVNNQSIAQFNSSQLDATPIGVGPYGDLMCSLFYDASWGSQASPIIQEDRASLNLDVGVMVLSLREDAVTQGTGATNDYQQLKSDGGGRLITTLAPAGETWKACSSAVTNTSDASIKAGVASNFLYVTSINCHNNSAVGSIATFKSNTTAIWSTYLGANTLSNNVWTEAFSIPLRLASGEALQFAMTTTSTSTICCAAGYQSTI